MQISVIIPCWNEAERVGHQLAALTHQKVDFEWEVVVVDNGSTDETRARAQRFLGLLPNLRIIMADREKGVSFARNEGARVAHGRWLVFVDADDTVSGGWLKAMAEALEAHPVVGSRFEGRWLNPGKPNRPLGQQQAIETLWYPPYLKHAGGSGLGVWREAHERVGGFDQGLKYLEDADYCIRLQLEGYSIHFEPSALIHIRYKAGRSNTFRQARSWARANTTLYRRYGLSRLATRSAWRTYAQGLWNVVRSTRKLRSERARAVFAWQTGWYLGLLEGAVMNRVAPVAQQA
ncbi:MAG: glycosyltransferase family 2 protein [Longimicrobiales bacterium]